MDTITAVCSLLEEKKKQLLNYEEATLAMLSCDADDVEHYIIERSKLAIAVDELGDEIARLCDGEAAGVVLLETAQGKMTFEKVPSEYQCVFYGAQGVSSVVNRIKESDKQVVERLELLRDEARQAIRQNQNLPKIKKYLTDLTDKSADGGLTSGKA